MRKKDIAKVILHIDKLTPISSHTAKSKSTLYTDCSVELRKGTKRVVKTKDIPGASTDPNSLSVLVKMSHKPVHFQITIDDLKKNIYHPIGVAFKQGSCLSNGAKAKPLNRSSVHTNFPQGSVRIVDDVLYFKDVCRGDCDKAVFEYYVIVQDSTDNIGIIDPGITHDDTTDGFPAEPYIRKKKKPASPK